MDVSLRGRKRKLVRAVATCGSTVVKSPGCVGSVVPYRSSYGPHAHGHEGYVRFRMCTMDPPPAMSLYPFDMGPARPRYMYVGT